MKASPLRKFREQRLGKPTTETARALGYTPSWVSQAERGFIEDVTPYGRLIAEIVGEAEAKRILVEHERWRREATAEARRSLVGA